jgi:cardiolipin synthase (CMP-forming)
LRRAAPRRLPATAGELWAQDLLRELRAANFAPSAWVGFLSASFARARLQRHQRRRQHRQALAVGGVGIGACIALALSGRSGLAIVCACWWTLVVLMLVWHLGLNERLDGRPLRGLGVANLLSLLRAALVPLLFAVPPTALAVLLLAAAATDLLDGPLARRLDQASRLGLWLDPAVDSLVIGAAAVAAARLQLLPVWVAVFVLARSLLPWIIVAAVAYFARAQAPDLAARVSGRVPGALVVGGLALAALHLPAATPLVVTGVAGGLLTFALTIRHALRLRVQTVRVSEDGRVPSVSRSARPSGNN